MNEDPMILCWRKFFQHSWNDETLLPHQQTMPIINPANTLYPHNSSAPSGPRRHAISEISHIPDADDQG